MTTMSQPTEIKVPQGPKLRKEIERFGLSARAFSFLVSAKRATFGAGPVTDMTVGRWLRDDGDPARNNPSDLSAVAVNLVLEELKSLPRKGKKAAIEELVAAATPEA